MFGLEKKPTNAPFEFDIEKDMKGDPDKKKKTLKIIEEKVVEIKGLLRQGAGSADFDNLGVLLHGYAALQRVLNRIGTKKAGEK
jgi:hypothetical protein